jgi:hypothetical protein
VLPTQIGFAERRGISDRSTYVSFGDPRSEPALRFHLENDLENVFRPTSRCSRPSGLDYPRHSVRRRGSADHLDKKHSQRGSEGTGVSLRYAGHANHCSGSSAAWNRYSAVGQLLSMAVPSVLGNCVLFLGEQLCDRGIRRCDPSVEVAPLGPARKHGGYADVGGLDWTSLCGCHSPGRRQVTISSSTSFRTRERGYRRSQADGAPTLVGHASRSETEE